MAIDESVQECRIRIGKKYLREIAEIADYAFGENYLHARVNRKEHFFEVWVTISVDKNKLKKFKSEHELVRVRFFQEHKSV